MIDEFAQFIVFFVGGPQENEMLDDVGVGLETARCVTQLNVNRLT